MFEPTKAPEFDKLDKYLRQLIKKKRAPGIIFLLYEKEETKYLQKYGWQDIENNVSIQFDTIFRMHSTTKSITTIAVMMLFEEGRFELNDPISKFLPEFKKMEVFVKEEDGKIITEPLEREITILDLFTHTSGLSYGLLEDDPIHKLYKDKLPFEKARTLSLEKVVKIITSIPLRFQPGKYFNYSYGIDVLGRLIEILSGKTLDGFLTERIFQPLEMPDTAFYVPEEKLDRFAQIYTYSKENRLKLLNTPNAVDRYKENPIFLSGGGGLVSTMKDFFNSTLIFLNQGKFKEKQLLSSETIGLITKNHLKNNKTTQDLALNNIFKMQAYGMGLGIRVLVKENIRPTGIGEHGWAGWGHTYYWIDPLNDVIGLFLTQIVNLNPSTKIIDFKKIKELAYAGLGLI